MKASRRTRGSDETSRKRARAPAFQTTAGRTLTVDLLHDVQQVDAIADRVTREVDNNVMAVSRTDYDTGDTNRFFQQVTVVANNEHFRLIGQAQLIEA